MNRLRRLSSSCEYLRVVQLMSAMKLQRVGEAAEIVFRILQFVVGEL